MSVLFFSSIFFLILCGDIVMEQILQSLQETTTLVAKEFVSATWLNNTQGAPVRTGQIM